MSKLQGERFLPRVGGSRASATSPLPYGSNAPCRPPRRARGRVWPGVVLGQGTLGARDLRAAWVGYFRQQGFEALGCPLRQE